MKKLFLFACLISSVFFTICADAYANTKYIDFYYKTVLDYNDQLSIYNEVDEELCREHYGDSNWYTLCATNNGVIGMTVDSIVMTPNLEGSWKWTSPNYVSFIFDEGEHWEPNQEVYVEFPVDLFGENTESGYLPQFAMTTPPQAAKISSQEVMIDPAPRAGHIVSFAINFLYPVEDKDAFLNSLNFEAQNSGSAMRFGSPELTWSRNDTHVNIVYPILELPQEVEIAELTILGMKVYGNDGGDIVADSMVENVNIPGIDSIFTVENMFVYQQYNADLAKEYLLTVNTSLQITAEELAQNMQIYSLPLMNTEEARTPYQWEYSENVVREEEISFTLASAPNTASTTHSFLVEAQPERYFVVDVQSGMPSSSGITMSEDKHFVLYADEFYPNISFLQNGNILNLEGERTLYLQTSQIESLRWEAQKVRVPYLAMLVNENSDVFNNYSNVDYYPLSEVVSGTITVDGVGQAASEVIALDMSDLLEESDAQTGGIINLKLVGMQGDEEVYFAERLVLITDIGLIVKTDSNGARQVFAYSMSEGEPLSDVELQIIGVNGMPIAEAETDRDGFANLPSVNNYSGAQNPTVLLAHHERSDDYSFITMQDSARYIETSSYDVQGRMNSLSTLQAFVFAERGIFRPSDMLNFSAIVRNSDNSLPDEMPLRAVLYDPQNVKIFDENYTLSEEDYGMHTFSWQSSASSSTGMYRLDILSNNQIIGSTSVSVEEFKPDTLALEVELLPEKTEGWYVINDESSFELDIQLDNLYGTGAQNRRVEGRIEFLRSNIYFDAYSSYTFNDPYSGDYAYFDYNLPTLLTDADGHANTTINYDFSSLDRGSYSATVYVEGFEPNGGRAVSTQLNVLLSPAETLLGYKTQGDVTDLNYIPQGRDGQLEIITIDSNLDTVEDFEYTFTLSENMYVRSLVSNFNNQYSYQNILTPEEIESTVLESSDGKIYWDIPTDVVGDFVLTVYAEGMDVPIASIPYQVVGSEVAVDQYTVPSTLLMTIEESDYAAGDTIDVALSTPYDGFGLITLESDTVLSHTWFDTQAGESVQELEIPDDYEGKAYVVIYYVKSMESEDIYLSPLAFNVEPVMVNISEKEMQLEIEVPEVYSSENSIEVTLTSDRDGKAIIFAVDEGILQLTSFETPSPIRYFLEDRALEVRTSQLADLLMAELDGQRAIQNAMYESAYGGGMELMANRAADQFLNPFQRKAEPPIVYWSGIVDVDSDGTTVNFDVPDYYNGDIRVMAVAVNDDSFGSTQSNTIVRKDLIINPQIPVMANPGDMLDSSVMIANTTDEAVEYNLELLLSNGVGLSGSIPQSIILEANEEIVLPISLGIYDHLGEATVTLRAWNDAEEYRRSVSLSIRPSTPYMTDLILGSTSRPMEFSFPREVYPYNALHELSVSYAPIPYIQAMVNFLEKYSFGCTEQLISRAMPYVMLNSEPTLLYGDEADPAQAEEMARASINNALYAISSSFVYGEGVAPWPSSYYANELLTVYAGDFLLSMRKAGFNPPVDLEDRVFDSIRNLAVRNPSNLEEARVTAYAIWVLTREGTVTTQYTENLLTRLENSQRQQAGSGKDENRNNNNNSGNTSQFAGWENDITAVFLAGTLDLLHMPEGQEIIDNFSFDFVNFERSSYLDALAVQALYMRVVAYSFADDLSNDEINEMVATSIDVFNRGYSTFSASQMLQALWLIGMHEDAPQLQRGLISCDNENAPITQVGNLSLNISSPFCKTFSIHDLNNNTLFYQLTNGGYSVEAPTRSVSDGLEIEKVILNGENQPVTEVAIGDIVTVQITANAHGGTLEDIVIQDLIAGGFEPVLDEYGSPITSAYSADHLEIREDRALFFTTLSTTESTFTYQLRAVNKGTFVLPAVYATSMYDTRFQAHDISGTIVIE